MRGTNPFWSRRLGGGGGSSGGRGRVVIVIVIRWLPSLIKSEFGQQKRRIRTSTQEQRRFRRKITHASRKRLRQSALDVRAGRGWGGSGSGRRCAVIVLVVGGVKETLALLLRGCSLGLLQS